MIPALAWEVTGIAIAAIVYLVFDTYPIVKCFRPTFCTGSFYLFWVILTFLNLIAYGVLKISAGDKIKQWVGPELAGLTLVLLATIGTVGILQSLTLKLADYRFVDIGKMIEGFRAIVLADIARRSADQDRGLAMAVARRIAEKYDVTHLRMEYQTVMTYAGRTPAEIGQELTQLQTDCTAAGLSFERAVAERIAQADIQHARQLLK